MGDYLDDMLDLNPILPEMYPSSSTSPAASCTIITPKLLSFEDSTNNSNEAGYTGHHEMVVKPQMINFSSLVEDDEHDDEALISGKIMRRALTTVNRTPLQAQDHVMAERKRRQKLSQLFITLSKVVPGLKKLDKASLLEDAIQHLKTLKERVNELEEEKSKKPIDSISVDEGSKYEENTSDHETVSGPEIKAMISEGCVLIQVSCKNQKGVMSRIPWEMEKMHLSVKDMRIMPFGGVTVVITILAQMQNEFRGTVNDIISQLEMLF